LARNDSPDIGYDVSLNPYRGCEHGCVYCYARPTHEYLGFSLGLDFESKIMVKEDRARAAVPRTRVAALETAGLGMGGVTDVYQPVERKLKLTRRCLEVFWIFATRSSLVTKGHLVTRDLELLRELSAFQAVSVAISLTTLDDDLWRVMEPRDSFTRAPSGAVHSSLMLAFTWAS
jgi:DNA repair photolyase